jgi:serine/threonine protein kinase
MPEASQKTVTTLGSDAGGGQRRDFASSDASSVASCANGRIGQLVSGKYRIVRRIARGGMGEVYEAEHLVLHRRVALKCLHPALAHDEAYVRRFCREAKAASSLQSEHIAAVTDIDLLPDGAPYLVMELLEGEDLARTIKRGPLPVSQAVDIGLQICRGLALAHRSGLVHRDLKPANVFLCRRADGTPLAKILDFGIAKMSTMSTAEDAALTGPGAVLGTAYYMAPEQARGSLAVDARADVYALGAVLYEAISGRRPFQGATYNEVLYKVMTTTPPPLGALDPELPTQLTAVIARAMAPDAANRHPTVEDLAADLSPFQDRTDAATTRLSLSAAVIQTPRAPGHARPGGFTSPVSTRSAIAIGVVVAVGAIALFAPWRRTTEPPPLMHARSVLPVEAPAKLVATSPISLPVSPTIQRMDPNFDETKAKAPRPRPPRTRADAPRAKEPARRARAGEGALKITTTPPALIYVDGKAIGTSPIAKYVLAAGRHVIEVRAHGYRPSETEVEVTPEQTLAVVVPLAAAPIAPVTPASSVKAPGPRGPNLFASPKSLVPKPTLPRSFVPSTIEQLTHVCALVESELVSTGGLGAAYVQGITGHFKKAVGVKREIHPVAMYYFLLAEAAIGYDKRAAAARLASAHADGVILKLKDFPANVFPAGAYPAELRQP